MGQKNVLLTNIFETDYMLETILFVYYLLFIYTSYLIKLDASRNNFLLNSQNNNMTMSFELMNIQSAEKGFSETICQFSDIERYRFWNWFGGIIDGNGDFYIKMDSINSNRVLKQVRIKLHNNNIRILTHIQNYLHIGKIIADKNKPYSIYIISTKKSLNYIVKRLNGIIRLKVPSFKKACASYNIGYIKANYDLGLYNSYFAGLVDTKGNIVFNYSKNIIECNLEFEYNKYTSKLNFDYVILNSKPRIIKREKSSNSKLAIISYKFQSLNDMQFIYDYFMHNRLYSDMKLYRTIKIKSFIEIRKYKTSKDNIKEKIYWNFIIDWFKYDNPLWYMVPYINKYIKSRYITDKDIVRN